MAQHRGSAHNSCSLVSAEMPAGSVPVSAFSVRLLITHTVTQRMPPRRPHRLRPPQGAGGAHSCVSAVSAEMLAGTLPTRPGFLAKSLQPGTVRY